MTADRELITRAITNGLFGEAALAEAAEVEIPDKYELLGSIGRGGFGIVYLCRDRDLRRLCALKFLLDARPIDRERLRREARFTARLNDPAIIDIYELGEASDGQPYIAMQYVDGGNLADADLEHEALVDVARQVAQALHRAHRHGIVHRDIKPENILLDAERRAYLTDFGVARDVHDDPLGPHVEEGLIVGTPALMPPEQARGDLRSIDARTDVYSLGACLYRMLTGRHPFDAPNILALLRKVCNDEPAFPRSIDAEIPRALEAIVLKCLRKDRENRYQGMDELATDLERWLEGRPVRCEHAPWFRRLVGAPAEPARGREDPATGVAMDIAREIAAWDADLYRISSNLTKAHPKLDAIIERLDLILGEHPDLAWARFYRGEARFRRGRLADALEDMERAIDRMSDLASAHFEIGRLYLTLFLREAEKAQKHIAPSGTRSHLGRVRGRLDQAMVAFREAQRLGGDEMPGWQLDYVDAVGKLADGDSTGCVAVCDRILEGDADLDEVWKLRGDAQRLAGEDPCPSYDQAVGVRKSAYEALYAKAEALLERGRAKDARAALDQALKIFPDFVEARALIARSYVVEAQADGEAADDEAMALAMKHLVEALKIDPSSYEVTIAYAELCIERGRSLERGEWLDRAFELLEKARSLDGCQNRVDMLTASAHLERSRHALARGDDPRVDLDAILALARSPEPGRDKTEAAPWQKIIAAAKTELTKTEELPRIARPESESDES